MAVALSGVLIVLISWTWNSVRDSHTVESPPPYRDQVDHSGLGTKASAPWTGRDRLLQAVDKSPGNEPLHPSVLTAATEMPLIPPDDTISLLRNLPVVASWDSPLEDQFHIRRVRILQNSRSSRIPFVRIESIVETDSNGEMKTTSERFLAADHFLVRLSELQPDPRPGDDDDELWRFSPKSPLPQWRVVLVSHFQTQGEFSRLLESFRSWPGIDEVEPDHLTAILETRPNDPEFASGAQWNLDDPDNPEYDIDAVDGWDTVRFAEVINVAVIDTGIDLDHPDLSGNLWTNPGEIESNGIDDDGNGFIDDIHGMSVFGPSEVPDDQHGHGTHVAGIIGAMGNNSVGTAGIAWEVNLMAVQYLSDTGVGLSSDAAKAIDYATGQGAHVINASWGGEGNSAILREAIRRAENRDVLFVAAAGNSGINIDNQRMYPAAYSMENIVSVGASHSRGALVSFSNFGAYSVDLVAPGHQIVSTVIGGGTGEKSGTSMAAPHVSGVAALLRSAFPHENYRDVVTRLLAGVHLNEALTGKVSSGGILSMTGSLLTQAGRPRHDDRSEAILVTSDYYFWRGDISDATAEDGERKYAGVASGNSVWFRWTVPYSGKLEINTRNSEVDTVVAVYRILENGETVPAGENDDAAPGVNWSLVSISAQKDEVILIAVDGARGFAGPVSVEMLIRPENDAFQEAKTITALPFESIVSNRRANAESGEPNHAGSAPAHSLWWKWVPLETAHVFLTTVESGPDTHIAVYEGTALETLLPVAANENFNGSRHAEIVFEAVAGRPYAIAVDSKPSEDGLIVLSVAVAQPPVFVRHPLDTDIAVGSSLFLSAEVTGLPPLTYEWMFEGSLLTETKAPTLSLGSVGPANSGLYTLIATNRVGSATSGPAKVKVTERPVFILKHPRDVAKMLGRGAVFSVTTDTEKGVSYQWLKNGHILTGAVHRVLELSSLSSLDEGSYSCRITRNGISVSSRAASLRLVEDRWDLIDIISPELYSDERLHRVRYVGDRFVVLGDGGLVRTSIDGFVWNSVTVTGALEGTAFNDVAGASGRYLIVGDSGQVFLSDDGLDWTSAQLPSDVGDLLSIAYGNGVFLAIATDGRVIISDDFGASFSVVDQTVEGGSSVVFGNGVFVIREKDRTFVTIDGEQWESQVDNLGLKVSALFDGEEFVAFKKVSSIVTAVYASTDGRTWAEAYTVEETLQTQLVATSGDEWYLSRRSSLYLSFDRGATWEDTYVDFAFFGANVIGIAVGNGNGVVTTDKGSMATWAGSSVTVHGSGNIDGDRDEISNIVDANGIYFGTKWPGHAASRDGLEWINLGPKSPSGIYVDGRMLYPDGSWRVGMGPLNSPSVLNKNVQWIAHSGARFVSVGGGSGRMYFATSDNGTDWDQPEPYVFSDSVSPPRYTGLAYGNGRFVAATNGAVVISSTDGRNWADQDLGGFGGGIAFGNGTFVSAGFSGNDARIHRSTDGLLWSNDLLPGVDDIYRIKFGGGWFVAITDRGLAVSSDGSAWRLIELPWRIAGIGVSERGILVSANGDPVYDRKPMTFKIPFGESLPPTVTLDRPEDVTVALFQPVDIRFSAFDPDGDLEAIEVRVNGELITTLSPGENSYRFTPTEIDTHTITIAARDLDGSETIATRTIRVGLPSVSSQNFGKDARDYTGVTWFGNQFVAWGENGLLTTSSNGRDWEVPPLIVDRDLTLGAKSQEALILLANEGTDQFPDLRTLYVTRDLRHWVRVRAGESGVLGMTEFRGRFYMVTSDGLYSSGDGETWFELPPESGLGAGQAFAGIVAGEDRVLAWALDRVYLSFDGISWAPFEEHFSDLLENIVFGNGVFFGWGQFLNYRSTDGIEWTTHERPENPAAEYGFTGGEFFLGRSLSSDGLNWVYHDLSDLFGHWRTRYGEFVGEDRDEIKSLDPDSPWDPKPGSQLMRSLAEGPASLVVVGGDGNIWQSPDGRRLERVRGSRRKRDTSQWISEFHFRDGLFYRLGERGMEQRDGRFGEWIKQDSSELFDRMAVGDGVEVFWRSSSLVTMRDGEKLSEFNTGCCTDSIGHGNGRFVAIAYETTYTSTDGFQWETTKGLPFRGQSQLTVGKNLFLATDREKIFTSTDGKMWTESFPGYYDHNIQQLGSLFFSGDRFFAVYGRAVHSSSNGYDWELSSVLNFTLLDATFLPDAGIHIGIGQDNFLYSSDDGMLWRQAGTAMGASSIKSADNRIFLYGSNDVDPGPFIETTLFDLRVDLNLPLPGKPEVLGVGDQISAISKVTRSHLTQAAPDGWAAIELFISKDSFRNLESSMSVLDRKEFRYDLLAPGEQREFAMSGSIPNDAEAGAYYIGTRIVAVNEALEMLTSNNTAVSPSVAVQIPEFELRLDITGEGRVLAEPGGLRFARNAQVLLTPVPAVKHRFSGWTGDIEDSITPLVLSMNADTEITAVFDPYFRLATSTRGAGKIEVAADQDIFSPGSTVKLVAQPEAGWVFVGWAGYQGDDMGAMSASSDLLVTMDSDLEITATFNLPLANWRDMHFDSDELGIPAISGSDADPDGDSLPNLLEFALGTDPRALSPAQPMQIRTGPNQTCVSYRQQDGIVGASVQIFISTDLQNWSLFSGEELIIEALSGGTVYDVCTESYGSQPLFFKIEASER